MVSSEAHATRSARFLNRFYAWRAVRARPATAFTSQPEPRTVGSVARGRQLMAGNFLFAGYLVEAEDTSIWDVAAPDYSFVEDVHGFAWLDDLAAVPDPAARARAQDWTWGWIARFGRGRGPGWVPDLAGRRLIRWINHALFLLRNQPPAASQAFFLSLGQQTIFLSRRWQAARPGLPRVEALTGLIYAGLALRGMEEHVAAAQKALEREAVDQIDAQGGLPTRNPEELLEVFTLLSWAAAALEEAERRVGPAHLAAIQRIAPTLRTLRHADGSLARFHGGGRGPEGRLDQALADSGVSYAQPDGLSMGYARLSAGRTSVIVDASPPPRGRASLNAHASTLAFELTSGRRALVVNCGSGESFGQDWRSAGRATPSHSTLVLDGNSSARVASGRRAPELEDGPRNVPMEMSHTPEGVQFEGGHDGYLRATGLTHARRLELGFDGRDLTGQDMLLCLEDADRKRFDRVMDARGLQGVPFDLRFHLHPEVEAHLDMGGAAVSLALKSGEVWVFRHDGAYDLTLEPSVFLEKNRIRPRASKQIVLSGRALEYATRIRWSFAKAQDTPVSVRDLNREGEDPALNHLT
ncbi:heparinase [Pseudooceanicola sediminis]|uniref:Heparinase n=1 Tax=Pseudooceanicola sediminis TaxID=2211117 RepID=A0A399J196_9RHOB|nr:heparinase II/III family protein [Pseudooceanicola sediminis]KAA2313413.1 heparinase [Puniceibacterium sp. HSS470]RII38309.1 heparinase [Pseudooceanicola sediminis]|tara:strand:+ start:70507 stop:72252 length:1746 start_codon:yes stop_codon:yes gene_type:complete